MSTGVKIGKDSNTPFGFKSAKKRDIVFLLVSIIPIIVYFFIIIKYTVNIPSADDYDMLSFFEQFRNLSDNAEKIKLLFIQHSEHRIVFNRLILLLSYYLTGTVNFKLFIVLGNLSLLASLFVFYKALRKNNHPIYYFLPIPFILFQLQYFENSTWALASLVNFSVILFSYLSLYFLIEKGWIPFVIAVVLAIIATFTSGSGIFTFIVGALLLMLQKRYKFELPVWIALFVVCAAFYFHDYKSVGEQTSIFTSVTTYPHKILIFFVAFLGSSLNLSGSVGIYVAIASGFAFCAFYAYLIRIKYYESNPLVFGLLLLIIISAAAAAVSRYNSGVFQAFLSRYKIHSTILLVLTYIVVVDLYSKKVKPIYFLGFVVLCIYFNILSNAHNASTIYVGGKNLMFGIYALTAKNPTNLFLSFHNKEAAQQLLVNAQKQKYYSLPANIVPHETSRLYNFTLLAESTMINAGFDIIDYSPYFIIHDGWAAFKEYNSVGVDIYVVLQSAEHIYIFDTYPGIRTDVTAFFSSLNFDNSGFTCLMSKDSIASGIYQIGLFLAKNDNIKAFQFTGKSINHIKPVSPVERNLPALTNNIIGSVDEWIEQENTIKINGWAAVAGGNSGDTKKYIVLLSDKKNYVFPATLVKRLDVTQSLKTFNYDNSGYTTLFNKDNIEEGNYQVGIYLEKDTVQAFQYVNKNIEIKHFKSVNSLQINLPAPTNNIISSVDEVMEMEDSTKISGWAAINGQDSKNTKIYIVLQSANKNYVYPTIAVKRPDVTQAFKNMDYDDSGYTTFIAKSSLAEGKYQVGIYIQKDTVEAFQYINNSLDIHR